MNLQRIKMFATRVIPNKPYLSYIYKKRFGKSIDWKNPQTFNEKLQWLKLYDRKPEYTQMVDKYEAKKYVAEKIGKEYIIPNLGIWEKFDDIDFDTLPNQFVLKCTHDSGGLVICKDKSKLDIEKARAKINRSLKTNYYWHGREWPYKNVKPRIIAEQFMEDDNTPNLRDYKFFCFHGEPKFLYISEGLEDHSTAQISFYDLDGNEMPFHRADFRQFKETPKMPETFHEMIDYSRLFAQKTGCPFVRIDFYCINGKTYFSEITFFPCGGMIPFEPKEWDQTFGSWIKLPHA